MDKEKEIIEVPFTKRESKWLFMHAFRNMYHWTDALYLNCAEGNAYDLIDEFELDQIENYMKYILVGIAYCINDRKIIEKWAKDSMEFEDYLEPTLEGLIDYIYDWINEYKKDNIADFEYKEIYGYVNDSVRLVLKLID